MGQFYFEQLLQTALEGIDSYNITTTVLGVAGTILLLSFLYSAYQAFAMGGDVRMLAIGGIAYFILGLVFVNYGTVFRDVIGMFNSVADFIYSSVGVGDLFSNWLSDLSNYFTQNGWSSLWGLVTGGISGLLGALVIIVAFIIFPLSYTIFTLFYALYGAILYVVGPFVCRALVLLQGAHEQLAVRHLEDQGRMGVDGAVQFPSLLVGAAEKHHLPPGSRPPGDHVRRASQHVGGQDLRSDAGPQFCGQRLQER